MPGTGVESSRVRSGRVGSAEASRVSDRSAAREREDVVTGGLDSNPFAQFVVGGIACSCGLDSYGREACEECCATEGAAIW